MKTNGLLCGELLISPARRLFFCGWCRAKYTAPFLHRFVWGCWQTGSDLGDVRLSRRLFVSFWRDACRLVVRN